MEDTIEAFLVYLWALLFSQSTLDFFHYKVKAIIKNPIHLKDNIKEYKIFLKDLF